MMNKPIRQPHLVGLQAQDTPTGRAIARGQNFTVERLAGGQGQSYPFSTATEAILLLPGIGARVRGDDVADVPGHAIAILPAGSYVIETCGESDAYLLATDRTDADAVSQALNAPIYETPDERVRPVGEPYRRTGPGGSIRIHPVSEIAIPPDNGRLRFLQSETISVNWVEYDGARDRSALSPHAHADAEQASLAIEGHFIHHLRTPWGRDADQWRDDQHLAAGPATVAIIPPGIIHTTEGSGDGRHLLIDIFAPPRADFIAKNWVFNADEYAAPDGGGA